MRYIADNGKVCVQYVLDLRFQVCRPYESRGKSTYKVYIDNMWVNTACRTLVAAYWQYYAWWPSQSLPCVSCERKRP